MNVGKIGSLGSLGINDDHFPRRIFVDFFQCGPCFLKAMAVPGVLADEDGEIRMLDIRVWPATEHLVANPELSSFFLRQGIGSISNPQR